MFAGILDVMLRLMVKKNIIVMEKAGVNMMEQLEMGKMLLEVGIIGIFVI